MKTIISLLLNSLLLTTAFAEESVAQRCVELNSIDLDDDGILNKNQQQKLFKQYMGSCIDGELLKAIIADISNNICELGFTLSLAQRRLLRE